jgi:hypothetical protein
MGKRAQDVNGRDGLEVARETWSRGDGTEFVCNGCAAKCGR